MYRLLPLLALLLQLGAFAQIDQRKLDSLAKSIDSSAKVRRQWQDSFSRAQDSVYRLAQSHKSSGQSSGTNGSSLAEKKQQERQQGIISLVAGLLIFAILLIVMIRKRKTKT